MAKRLSRTFLVADARERAVIPFIESEFQHHEFFIKQVTTADYLICRQPPDGEAVVLAAFERKSHADFAASFKDGRHKSAADDPVESAQVKRYVQMPYEELDTDDAGAYREKVRRYLVYVWTMGELGDCYPDHENDGLLVGDVQDETAVEVANDTVSTGTLLGFIRTREDAQLRRFGAEHLTAFARHDAAATAADVPFKHLFGLPITRSVEEYEDAYLDGDAAAQAYWDGD